MSSLDVIRNELDSRIINPDFKDLKDIFEWFSGIEIIDIKQYYEFSDDCYCRVPLIVNTQYELLLCCWMPGQLAPFHGHPEQGCLVKILEGTMTETIKYTDGRAETRLNRTGDVAYISDKIGIHQVQNNSDRNAVSLHLYAPGGYKPDYT